jgi:RNA polymerase sigma-70 factor (ECF subfamily)
MDADLARRARFEAVAREVWSPLSGYVRRRVSAADADDIVNETLTVLWRRLDEVPDDAVLPWTFATARRTLANHRRSDVRRRGLVDRVSRRTRPSDLTDHQPADRPSVDDPALERALAELPDEDVEVLRLWAWEQMEPREIALVLGISANTASARLSRLRKRLADRLAPDMGGHATTGAGMTGVTSTGSRHDGPGAGHIPGAERAEPPR